MESDPNEQMALAMENRRQARRPFQRAINSCVLTKGSQGRQRSSTLATRQSEEEWDKCRPLQVALLERALVVIQLSAQGMIIADNKDRCESINKDPVIFDICYELGQLFQCVVSKTTRKLRHYLDKPGITSRKCNWAHKLLTSILNNPLKTFLKAADTLGGGLLRSMDDPGSQYGRLRLAMIHVLMYVSDCFRYSLDHKNSLLATELMRLLAPDDPESHMRMGMNLALLTDMADALKPFYYYCVFLANRGVKADHREADVVSRFVRNVRRLDPDKASHMLPIRRRFSSLFIDALWALLTEDFDCASQKVKGTQLWDAFGEYQADVPAQPDMLHMVGALTFVHYRISPRGNEDGKILLRCSLTDFAVCSAITSLSKNVAEDLRKLSGTLRTRRKNRRRALQKKKRRVDGALVRPISAETVARETLKDIGDLDKAVPQLGPLSFLTHYWSITRSAPSPSSDLDGMAAALQSLQQVIDEIERIEEATFTGPLTSQITSKLLVGNREFIPALPEDIMFSVLLPCRQLNMYRDVRLQEVPLPSVLGSARDGFIRSAMLDLGDNTYESVVGKTARRHLEAFAQQCLKDVRGNSTDKDSTAIVVAMAIRKLRVKRLIRGLEKVGGGRLIQMVNLETQHAGEDDDMQYQPSQTLPQPGQPIEDGKESFQRQLSSDELGFQLKKRRRVMGTCTPAAIRHAMPSSQSVGSSDRLEKESPLAPRGASNVEIEDKRRENAPDIFRTGPPPASGRKKMSHRHISRGSLLSQGSLQICYAQPPEPVEPEQADARDRAMKQSRGGRLSRILQELLYPPDAPIVSPPSGMTDPAFWRNSPSDEFEQNVIKLGATRSSQ